MTFSLALGCSAALPAKSAVQVELLEGDVAVVVDLDTGREAHIARRALPKGAREGDIVVDGRVDPGLTQRLQDEVKALHERLAVPVPPGLSLDDPPPRQGRRGSRHSLTADQE